MYTYMNIYIYVYTYIYIPPSAPSRHYSARPKMIGSLGFLCMTSFLFSSKIDSRTQHDDANVTTWDHGEFLCAFSVNTIYERSIVHDRENVYKQYV